jgi:kumamolisin
VKRANTGSGRLEVHILNGANNYQSFLLQTPTPITQTDAANFWFAVGDFNGDGIPDLYYVKHTNTGTGRLEVHVLSGASNYQTFLLQTGTPITQADASNFSIAVSSRSPDLYCLKRTNAATGVSKCMSYGAAATSSLSPCKPALRSRRPTPQISSWRRPTMTTTELPISTA